MSIQVRISPDLDDYASGRISISQVRCVLCGKAPCQCKDCPVTYENKYYLATGRPQFETCTMRIDPATGECPRGHRVIEGQVIRAEIEA